VERSPLAGTLWVKRDDLASPVLGGNKVRALEFLLGGVCPGDTVVTVGARGSTHALATALHAARLDAGTVVHRWPQVMNATARLVDARLRTAATVHDSVTVPTAYVRALLTRAALRLRGNHARWIPAGGTTPLGILGHVDAALELARQVEAGLLPAPERVVLPLGSGGTAAGLVLGFALAELRTRVVGVQVVPRLVASAARVRWLVERTRRLVAATAGSPVPRAGLDRFEVERAFYGGAYGRETLAGRDVAHRFRDGHGGAMLDLTYSAKACAAALARCDGAPTLFWHTFDSRPFVMAPALPADRQPPTAT